MNKTLAIALVAFLTAGCVSPADHQAPTHRWASTTAADEIQYRNDHARCQVESQGSGNTYEADSVTFDAYKRCMNNRGYELTAYR